MSLRSENEAAVTLKEYAFVKGLSITDYFRLLNHMKESFIIFTFFFSIIPRCMIFRSFEAFGSIRIKENVQV